MMRVGQIAATLVFGMSLVPFSAGAETIGMSWARFQEER